MVVGLVAHCHNHTAHGYRYDAMKPDMYPGRLFGSLLLAGGLLASSQGVASGPQCSTLPPLPGGITTETVESDTLCNVDFTSTSVAICPKTWSTSPAALIYDLRDTSWAGKSGEFEAQVCPRGRKARDEARAELAVFKHSMNGRDTSATYAPSSLLYADLARWLGLRIYIPVAALQEFPRKWYLERVARYGEALTADKSSVRMLHAAWQATVNTLSQPDDSTMATEMLSGDGASLWGVNLLFTGKRYGPEVNGTRASGWGKGQNRDFQQTAPFLLLRHDQPLSEATRLAINEARTNSEMAQALPEDIAAQQVQWWASEVIEIVLLDYLLGQQDRIGNIDYQWRWFWVEDQKVSSRPAKTAQAPADLAAYKPIRLRATWLNDNDAGVRTSYANFSRLTGMLDGLRRFDPILYTRIRLLSRDFAAQGPVYQAIRDNYRIRSKELEKIATRLAEIDTKLSAACKAGELRWDLDATAIISAAKADTAAVTCDI